MLVLSASPTLGSAQGHDNHGAGAISSPQRPTGEENALVSAVRDATVRFKSVTSVDGPGENYKLAFGCVSGGDFGTWAFTTSTWILVDGDINVNQPEIILFEPRPNGRMRITGVDFLVRGRCLGGEASR